MHRDIKVVLDDKILSHDHLVGQAHPSTCKIALASSNMNPDIMARDEAASVFWHEVWHFIMSVLNERELADNEKLSDQFGGLMAQLMKTADWRPPSPPKSARPR